MAEPFQPRLHDALVAEIRGKDIISLEHRTGNFAGVHIGYDRPVAKQLYVNDIMPTRPQSSTVNDPKSTCAQHLSTKAFALAFNPSRHESCSDAGETLSSSLILTTLRSGCWTASWSCHRRSLVGSDKKDHWGCVWSICKVCNPQMRGNRFKR